MRLGLRFDAKLPIRDGVKMRTLLPAVVAALALLGAGQSLATEVAEAGFNPFPEPAALQPAVRFWTRIYSEVGTDGGLIHDSRDLSVVYEVLKLPSGLSRRARERFTEKRKKHYKQILHTLARGKRSGLSVEQQRVLALFPAGATNKTLRGATRRVRFQLGQADKFRAGLIRSGTYVTHIERTLRDMGLPVQIAALPHVESSYTPHAYSRVGAAGLWQFTRSTGRRFMRVDHVVDERLDPYRSAVAAARLLKQNRRVTGSWPLAITAYNHGASGMRRAVRKLGTRDIATIVRDYRSRTFGFASRNFYVEFLAASHIAANPEPHFGKLTFNQPVDYDTVELPFYTTPLALSRAFGVEIESLRAANPALRPSVWRGQKRVPKGFVLAVPRVVLARPLHVAIADVAEGERWARQTRDVHHVVQRGETLSRIAARYGVRMSELQALNGLRSRHRIRAGQKLRLPSDHSPARATAVRRAQPAAPVRPPPDGLYTVRRGDTLSRIASRFDMREDELITANALRNRNRIYVGQVLRVSTAVDKAIVSKHKEAAASDLHPQAMALLTPARSTEPSPVPREPAAPAAPASVDSHDLVAVAADIASDADPSGPNPGLLADPSDYSVAADGTIEIQAIETLGHYAEWLGLRAGRLRSINHLSYGEPLVVHEQLKLDFSHVTPEQFEQQRLEYHRDIQEQFFTRWEIAGTEVHRIRAGDSLWVLSHRKFEIPLWLLYQYNPDLDFESLSAGNKITVPLLRSRDLGADAQISTVSEPQRS